MQGLVEIQYFPFLKIHFSVFDIPRPETSYTIQASKACPMQKAAISTQ